MDNAIYGSAKAWVNFNGFSASVAIRQAYNVSSVTRTGSGQYTVNFTNALVDANYSVGGMASYDNLAAQTAFYVNGPAGTMTTTQYSFNTNYQYNSTNNDCKYVMVQFFR